MRDSRRRFREALGYDQVLLFYRQHRTLLKLLKKVAYSDVEIGHSADES